MPGKEVSESDASDETVKGQGESSETAAIQEEVVIFLDGMLAWYRSEIARGDTKSSTLLAVASAALAALIALATSDRELQLPALVTLGAAVLCLATSAATLLVMQRPRRIHDRFGDRRFASVVSALDGQALATRLIAERQSGWRGELLVEYARHIHYRSRQLTVAVNLLLVGFILGALLAAVTMAGL